MARPIAYNASGPLSGSIRGGSVNYTIDGAGRDYTTFAGKKWVPSADGAAPIVFVTDSFTRGLTTAANAYPLFFSCAGTGSAAILYTANRLPGSPGNFTDTGSAFYDLTVSYGYFILEGNDPYQGDYGSGNYLTLDASKTTSYPQSSPKFFDLSGNGFTFDLINGPTWDSNGWFAMDGTDDSIFASSPATAIKATKTTLVMWFRTTDTVGLLLSGQPPYAGGAYYVGAWTATSGFYESNCGSPSYHIDCEQVSDPISPVAYNDGRFHMWEAKDLTFGGWTNNWNFGGYDGSYSIVGDIAKIEIYSSSLSPEQSKQNYFGSQIVIDGMVFAVDANNIVSYPKSGTDWYNLTGSNNGTLSNGPIFNPSNGGSIVLDGVDDYVNFGTVDFQTSNNITLDMWVYPQSATQEAYADIFDANHSANGFVFQQDYLTYNYYYFAYYDGSGFQVTSNILIEPYVWSHIVITKEGNQTKIYKNGQLVTNNTMTNPSLQGTNTFYLGRFVPGGRQWNGKYGNFKGYNKALSAAEVQQNYQAEQYRFEGPAGITTNGLVLYFDAGNLDSYPGTGTIWYDLMGNINGDLINGVGFSTANGGVLTFDGVDDFIQYTSLLNVGNTFTVNCWIKPTANTRQTIVSNGYPYSTNKGFFMACPGNNSTDLFISLGQDQKLAVSNTGMVTTGAWQMVTARVNGASELIKLYINGVEVTYSTQTDANITLQYDTGVFTTGCRNGVAADDRLYSNFATLQIYNRALSTTEITQNYNYFKGRFGL
jgi:hypothetical protein